MSITLRHLSALCVGVALIMTTSAFADDPTAAQKSAVKSNCRNDFIAHCIGVSPADKPAYDCLVKHVSSLSSSCKAAVQDIQSSQAAPAAAPAAAAAKPAAEPATTTQPAKGADSTPKAASAAPAKPSSEAKA